MLRIYFYKEIAEKLGLEGAIVLQYLKDCILDDASNKNNIVDDNVWHKEPVNGIIETLSFMNRRQAYRVLDKLVEQGYIIRKIDNASVFDKTRAYALTDAGWDIFNLNKNGVLGKR